MSRPYATHCKRGHELNEENCYATLWPHIRKCRKCVSIRGAVRREREKAWRRTHPRVAEAKPRVRWIDDHGRIVLPKSSADLARAGELTASERMLVLRCVAAIQRYESAQHRRIREGATTFRRGAAEESEVEKILEGIPWRRQVTLMSCAIAQAREAGVTFAYTKNSSTYKRIREGA